MTGEGASLHLGLRIAYLIAGVLLLVAMPWGQVSVLLLLFVAVDLAAAAMFLRSPPPRQTPPVVELDSGVADLALRRRTVPTLRMRRPAEAIEAQLSWRQAAQSYRRRREIAS